MKIRIPLRFFFDKQEKVFFPLIWTEDNPTKYNLSHKTKLDLASSGTT